MAYLVRSLVNLRAEIDHRWPRRQRRAEGWYTDPRVRRSYGHNPDGKGAVHAIDIDRIGVDPYWIIRNIYTGGGVLWYIIYNRQLFSRTYGGKVMPYKGSNPHTDHLHIEVYRTGVAENYGGYWGIWRLNAPPPPVGTPAQPPPPPSTQWGDADALPAMDQVSGALSGLGGTATNHARAMDSLRTL